MHVRRRRVQYHGTVVKYSPVFNGRFLLCSLNIFLNNDDVMSRSPMAHRFEF